MKKYLLQMVWPTADPVTCFECFKAYHVGFGTWNSIKLMVFLATHFCIVYLKTHQRKILLLWDSFRKNKTTIKNFIRFEVSLSGKSYTKTNNFDLLWKKITCKKKKKKKSICNIWQYMQSSYLFTLKESSLCSISTCMDIKYKH